MVSGQDEECLWLFNFPKQQIDRTKLKLLSEDEFQPHRYQPSQSTTKGVQPAKLCAKLHCLHFQPSLDLYALWQNSFEIPLRDSTLTSIGRPADHTALLPKVIGCQIGNCHCLSKCTGGGKHAQRERERGEVQKGGFGRNHVSPQAVLPFLPPHSSTPPHVWASSAAAAAA